MENDNFEINEKVFVLENPICFESVIVGKREDIKGAYYVSVGREGEKQLFFKSQLYKTSESLLAQLKDDIDYLQNKIKWLEERDGTNNNDPGDAG